MRKLTRRMNAVFIIMVMLILTGCKAKGDVVKIDEKYLCPWVYDVSAQAKQDGMLHYYFFSSEGYVTKNGKPAKWGDSCLVVFPDGQTMLIDGGPRAYGNMLVANLKRMGVEKIDHLVITHPHLDHQGGIFHADNLTGRGLLDQLEVVQVYHRGGTDNTREDSLWVESVCAERKLPLKVLEKGDALSIGGVSIEVLWPMPGTSDTNISGDITVNNSSVVLRFDYGEHSSLFTGDLYHAGEMVVISANSGKLDVDMLKAPHHGSTTSSSSQLLTATSPEIAVATGYLSDEYLAHDAYEAHDIKLLNDRTYGYIHVSSDGTDMTFETSRQEALPVETVPDSGAVEGDDEDS